ncbi:hypothetical protein CLOM_g24315 [Closterium sp. NIES-68]|nr:hypothetical protein CLOM_g24315 [Closterium sp. NIES-68]GJP75213.1 hypothetical protein CLOP_g5678 [Closterium sp. NIES-67]
MSRAWLVVALLCSAALVASAATLAGTSAGPRCKNRFPRRPLCKFVDDLATNPLAVIDGTTGKMVKIGVYQKYQKFHRDLPATKQYVYGKDEKTANYPGPVIVAQRGVETQVYFENHLMDRQHMFTVDYTLMPGIPKPKLGGIPVVPHRHGGEQESDSDGHPLAWFTQFGETGPTFKSRLYHYHNKQNPAAIWYHDHTIGWTRLNTVAGIGALYVIKDPKGYERKLKWLPSGAREVALAIADRMFFANGSINYPNVGNVPRVHPNWNPEYLGDTIVVNGKVWPYMRVRPAMYRMRLLNAANARVFNLKWVCAARADYPNFIPPIQGAAMSVIQIGTDGGYLVRPVRRTEVLIAPGERVDLLVDFSELPSGCKDVIVTNDARAPYPAGEPVTAQTGVVMRINILKKKRIPSPPIPKKISWMPKVPAINRERYHTLVEIMDRATNLPTRVTIDGKAWMDPVTETPKQGDTEAWYIINLTADAHPMHLHLVQHRPAWRRPFDVAGYQAGRCSFTDKTKPSCYSGNRQLVPRYERDWKDTTLAFPGEVLAIIASFKRQDMQPWEFNPTTGPGYVWHCHILDHEDNDMMRPMVIKT